MLTCLFCFLKPKDWFQWPGQAAASLRQCLHFQDLCYQNDIEGCWFHFRWCHVTVWYFILCPSASRSTRGLAPSFLPSPWPVPPKHRCLSVSGKQLVRLVWNASWCSKLGVILPVGSVELDSSPSSLLLTYTHSWWAICSYSCWFSGTSALTSEFTHLTIGERFTC